MKTYFTCGELFLPTAAGQKLPLGVFARALKTD
jgi:hypothetical protein